MRDTQQDRRATPRAALTLDLELMRTVGNAVSARTLDISVNGARVVSRRPLRIDEELHFDLTLPGGIRHLEGTARVLRQHRGDVFALRFEQLEAAVARQLDALVGAPDLI